MIALEDDGLTPETAKRVEAAAFVKDADSRSFLEGYLRDSLPGGSHVAEGGTRAAISFLTNAEFPPRVLIVDLSDSDTPLTEIDRLAEVCEPSIVVIAIGEKETVHLFRELIRSGVTDYLTKPIAPELLDPYIRERRTAITAASGTARRGKIVAVSGGRGGVGATTIAVNAAWLLANELKRRVALVDLDLHAGAACVQLGIEPGGLVDALANHSRLDGMFLERTMVRHGQRLAVLSEETPLTKDTVVPLDALDNLLDALAEDFHFVIVDLPRTFGVLHAHVFNKARMRVVVCERTLPALRDGARLLELGRQTGEATLLVMNDHHPGLANIIDDKTIAEALGRGPDLDVAYDKKAAYRGDNLGEALAGDRGPLAAASRDLVAMLTGRARNHKRNWLRRLLARGGAR